MLETGFLKEDSHDTGSLAWGFVMKDCIGALQTFLHRVFQLVVRGLQPSLFAARPYSNTSLIFAGESC